MIKMKTVTMDQSGKIYFPKAIRRKIRERKFAVVVLPAGTIMLHFIAGRDPLMALKEFPKLPPVTNSIQKIKADIEKEAYRSVE